MQGQRVGLSDPGNLRWTVLDNGGEIGEPGRDGLPGRIVGHEELLLPGDKIATDCCLRIEQGHQEALDIVLDLEGMADQRVGPLGTPLAEVGKGGYDEKGCHGYRNHDQTLRSKRSIRPPEAQPLPNLSVCSWEGPPGGGLARAPTQGLHTWVIGRESETWKTVVWPGSHLYRGTQGKNASQVFDVRVSHADASMAHPLADRSGIVRAMQADHPSPAPVGDGARVGG